MVERIAPVCGCRTTGRLQRGMCKMHYKRWSRAQAVEDAPITDADKARFWAKVDKTDTCWNWTGSLTPGGYSQFSLQGGRVNARGHRVSYEIHCGKVPLGLQLDHLCRNRRCVNPAHLEAVTQRVNTLRGTGPTAVNARATHCKQGHGFTAQNTVVNPRFPRSRTCRECARLASVAKAFYSRYRENALLVCLKPDQHTDADKARFWAKVDKTGTCWNWTGSRLPSGYPRFNISKPRGSGYGHRFSYEIHYGEIPAGLAIQHLCGNFSCVRPEHLHLRV